MIGDASYQWLDQLNRPDQVCDLLRCVGKLTCWAREKQSSTDLKSEMSLQSGRSTWTLTSPNGRTGEERENAMVGNSDNSEINEELGLDGR